MKRSIFKASALAGAITLLMSGCATIDGSKWTNNKAACTVAGVLVGGAVGAAADSDSDDRDDIDNGALIGAVAGGLLGHLMCGEEKKPAPKPVMAPAPAPAPPPPPPPAPAPEPPADSDGDGVLDRDDQCPDTPAGTVVNAFGCEEAAPVRLNGVNFELDSAKLTANSTTILDQAANTLASHPSMKVEVAGHTDSTGKASYNKDLSKRRANTVREYLIANGASADQLTTNGYGEEDPVADNSTRAGRAENRRVELRIQ